MGEESMSWNQPWPGQIARILTVLACLAVVGTSAAQAADCTRPKGLKGSTPHVIKFETGSAEISPEEQAWFLGNVSPADFEEQSAGSFGTVH